MIHLAFDHRRVKIYDCEECEKSFANKSNLNRHMAVKHPDEDSDMESEDDSLSMDEDEEGTNNLFIWKYILEESEKDQDTPMETYKLTVKLYHLLRNDQTHKSIMETVQRARDEEDMDFAEALDYAVDKRKFLIQRKIKEAKDHTS